VANSFIGEETGEPGENHRPASSHPILKFTEHDNALRITYFLLLQLSLQITISHLYVMHQFQIHKGTAGIYISVNMYLGYFIKINDKKQHFN
jgi:hypothetical protein